MGVSSFPNLLIGSRARQPARKNFCRTSLHAAAEIPNEIGLVRRLTRTYPGAVPPRIYLCTAFVSIRLLYFFSRSFPRANRTCRVAGCRCLSIQACKLGFKIQTHGQSRIARAPNHSSLRPSQMFFRTVFQKTSSFAIQQVKASCVK
jgi:hypothetical protein